MRANLLTILCKFGSDRAIFGVVVAIAAKKFTDTDTQTDDRRRAIVLAHSLNELKLDEKNCRRIRLRRQSGRDFGTWPRAL